MAVSIVMPVHNEEAEIEHSIRSYHTEIIDRLEGSELILVDDQSTDRTATILERLEKELPSMRIIRMEKNQGHGQAVRTGYEQAQKPWIFQVDSDGQFESADFWKLYEIDIAADLKLGTRKPRRDGWFRSALSLVSSLINLLLFGVWVKDANCPFRLMDREFVHESLDSMPGELLAPNIALSLIAKKQGSLIQVPVKHLARSNGETALRNGRLVSFSVKALGQLVRLRSVINKAV